MANASQKHVVVIGAGIVGASVAYHLASKGAKVTVLEAGAIAAGVTGRSFAWLNTSNLEDDPISELRACAIGDYHRLQALVPGLEIQWSGALTYGVSSPVDQAARVQSGGAAVLSTAQIRQLEPNLKNPPHDGLYAAYEGALDAVAAAHALIAGARQLGADVHTQTPVVGFVVQDAKVIGVSTANGVVEADRVVLAAGTGTSALAEMLGVALPIQASPAIFIRYAPQPQLVHTLISNAQMEVRQSPDGTLLAAEDYIDAAPENQPAAIALRTAKAIAGQLQGAAGLEPQFADIGLRPMPADGVPIIGPLPTMVDVYVCAMHPGVVLAAVVGRLVSEEIVDEQLVSALEPCRPARFTTAH